MTHKKTQGPPRRNPVARSLANTRYSMRVLQPKKGKGSYQRRAKHSRGVSFLSRWVGACGLFIAFITPSFAQDEQKVTVPILGGKEVAHLLNGSVLYGEYTDGRPDWVEHTAVTGQVLDGTKKWEEVGRWSIMAHMACYKYHQSSVPACFDVALKDGQALFFTPGTDKLIAYTVRIEHQPTM